MLRTCSKGHPLVHGNLYITPSSGRKRCKTCRRRDYRRRKTTEGYNATQRLRGMEFRVNNREKQRVYMRRHILKKRYGMTIEDYERMLEEQGGCCAICGTDDPGVDTWSFCVDHDHITGKVRALLCRRCNTGLGQFRDDIQVLRAALRYLEEHCSSSLVAL